MVTGNMRLMRGSSLLPCYRSHRGAAWFTNFRVRLYAWGPSSLRLFGDSEHEFSSDDLFLILLSAINYLFPYP